MPEDFIQKETSRSYGSITNAPLIIIACTSMTEMDTYPDPTRQQNEWIMATQSTALAVQNLLLAAHALVMTAVCMLACVVPARRALRIEPTEALSSDG